LHAEAFSAAHLISSSPSIKQGRQEMNLLSPLDIEDTYHLESGRPAIRDEIVNRMISNQSC
jgi:hypothetical protein